MKTMMTLPELAAEVKRVADEKVDYRADTRRLALVERPTTDESAEVALTLDDVGSFGITDHTHGQIADRLGIPKKYYDRLRVEAPSLLAENANHWLHERPEVRQVRTLDGRARAFVSDRYRRLDNYDLAEAVLPILGELPEVRFESLGLTDTRMYIKAVLPRIEGEVRVGETVQAGVLVSNSEVGAGALVVAPLIFTLVCSNGMVMQDYGQRRYHVGRRVEEGDDPYSIFSDETREADDRAFYLKVRDTVQAASSEANFQAIVGNLRELTEIRVKGSEAPDLIERLGDRHGLTEGERGSVLDHLLDGGDLTAWGVVSAVTRVSQDAADYDRASELERLGGVLTALPPQNWRLN